jgi:hypothetical protein
VIGEKARPAARVEDVEVAPVEVSHAEFAKAVPELVTVDRLRPQLRACGDLAVGSHDDARQLARDGVVLPVGIVELLCEAGIQHSSTLFSSPSRLR